MTIKRGLHLIGILLFFLSLQNCKTEVNEQKKIDSQTFDR